MRTGRNRFSVRTAAAALLVGMLLPGCQSTPPPFLMMQGQPAASLAPRTKTRHRATLPRIMLLIDEKNLGTIATSEVQALGTSLLQEEDVQVIDQDMARSNINKDQQMLRMSGDVRGAVTLGLQYGAEVMVVGEAVAKPSARRIAESNLRTYQAVVTLRAVRTDNSRTLASASETASIVAVEDVAGGSQSLKKAGRTAFEALIPKMLDAWERDGGTLNSQSMNRILLTVGGVDKTWKLKAVRGMLEGMDHAIESVVQRTYASGLAVFELDSAMPAQALSETLILTAPEGLKFQVVDVAPGKINLRTVEARPAP